MVQLEPAVKKETLFAFVSASVGTVAVQLIFLIIGRWDLSVLWGGLIGFAVSAGNFFLMALTMQKAIETGDENRAKMLIRASYLWRTLFQLGVLALSLILDCIHWVPVVCALFFIRVAIFFRQLFAKKEETPPASQTPAPPVEDEDEDEEPTDEYEKFVEHFGKRTKVSYDTPKKTPPKQSDDPSDKEP